MADRVLLVLAETAEGKPVAGALNLIGSDALYGRNWGSIYGDKVPFLHFEVSLQQRSLATHRRAHWPGCSSLATAGPPIPARPLPRCSSATTRHWSLRLNGACAAWRRGRRVSAGAEGWCRGCAKGCCLRGWSAQDATWPCPAPPAGEHKMQRGYVPSLTYSLHYLTDPGFSGVVAR